MEISLDITSSNANLDSKSDLTLLNPDGRSETPQNPLCSHVIRTSLPETVD